MSDWFIIFVVVPFVIGFVGVLAKRAVLGPREKWPIKVNPKKPEKVYEPGSGFTGIKKLYFTTLGWHPLLAGLLIGLVGHWLGLPKPPAFGTGYAGTILAYLFAGGVASIGYSTIVRTIRRVIAGLGSSLAGGRSSEDDEELGEDP